MKSKLTSDSYTKGKVLVEWVELGEGYDGDYNENDPGDVELLRFDVLFHYKKGEPSGDYHEGVPKAGWYAMPDASYCTMFPVSATPKQRKAGLKLLMEEFYDAAMAGNSVKRIGETMSWMELHDIDPTIPSTLGMFITV